MSLPIYLYCTMAKPYLSKDIVSSGKYVLTNTKDYFNRGDLNGTVCFKCECKEAFLIPSNIHDLKHTPQEFGDFLKRACLSVDELSDYTFNPKNKKRKFSDAFFLHLEEVEAIPQVGIDDFAGINGKPLKKAPQSWCHASRWLSCKPDEGADVCIESPSLRIFYKRQMCIIISIRPEWLCKIANGEKDLEVRKSCPKEIDVK